MAEAAANGRSLAGWSGVWMDGQQRRAWGCGAMLLPGSWEIQLRAAGRSQPGQCAPGTEAPELCRQSCVAERAAFLPPLPFQVDDRLATEGTGLAFGISDPALFFAIGIVFTTVWAVFYSGAKNLGGDKGDDSGLTL